MIVVKFTPNPDQALDLFRVRIAQGAYVNEQEYQGSAVFGVEGQAAIDITAQAATVTAAGVCQVSVQGHAPDTGWGPLGVTKDEIFPGQFTVTDVKPYTPA